MLKPGLVLASWNQHRGVINASRQQVASLLPAIRTRLDWEVDELAALDLLSYRGGDLQLIAGDSGLRHVAFLVSATRMVRAERQAFWERTATPADCSQLSELLRAALLTVEARCGSLAGVQVGIALQGLLPHPPMPWPKRRKRPA